jgi:hypothetical protein
MEQGRIEKACGCDLGSLCVHAGTTIMPGHGVTISPTLNGPNLLRAADALAEAVAADHGEPDPDCAMCVAEVAYVAARRG